MDEDGSRRTAATSGRRRSGRNTGCALAPGTLNASSTTFAGGGTFQWELNNAAGTAGTANGWSVLNVAGTLALTAATSNTFTISVQSLTLSNGSGLAANFNPESNYSFLLVSTSGGVTNFNPGDFTINTTGLQNSVDCRINP